MGFQHSRLIIHVDTATTNIELANNQAKTVLEKFNITQYTILPGSKTKYESSDCLCPGS